MNDKSHVSLATKYCPICDEEFETGELLLATRIINGELEKPFEKYTCTGVDLCPKHAEMVESGEFAVFFVATGQDCKTRTGEAFMIRKTVADKLFDRSIGPVNHCDRGLLEKVQSITVGEKHE